MVRLRESELGLGTDTVLNVAGGPVVSYCCGLLNEAGGSVLALYCRL